MNRKILKLALPNIVTNITIPLLGMVDLGLMGHQSATVFLGAVALGTMIFSFIFWGFGFLRMGTSGFTAQAYGSRDLREAILVLHRSLLVALAAGLLLILFQNPVAGFAFWLLKGSAATEALAREYYHIRIYAAPATLCLYALTGWFIGMQNARTPMILAISVNVLNIGFSLLFIKAFGMRSNGIALANVLSQCTGIVIAFFFLRPYLSKLRKYWDLKAALQLQAFGKFMNVNKDIFIRTLCLIFTFSFFTSESARVSDTVLAVNTLLFQFLYFFSYFIDGFAYAAEALAGKYLGSGNKQMLRRIIARIFTWATVLAGLYSILYLFVGEYVLRLMTDNATLISAARPYFFWVILLPLSSFAAFVWDGIYVGSTASVAMRNSMLIITLGIFLPAYFLFHPSLGNHALWLAMILFMLARGVFLTAMAPRAIYGRLAVKAVRGS